MAAGRYFRVLTSYDLLGNLLPGVFVLVVVITLFPNPPIPIGTGGILFSAVLGYSLGHLVQSHAAEAAGDCFEATLVSVREYPLREADSNVPESDEINEDGLAWIDRRMIELKNLDLSDLIKTGQSRANRLRTILQSVKVWSLIVPFYRPLSCFIWNPPGEILDDETIAFEVFKDLVTRYDIEPGTADYHRLINIISSEIDDISSPARSTRFQAIRNFHRAMWIASWYIFVIVTFLVLAKHYQQPRTLLSLIGLEYNQPGLFSYWGPDWHFVVVFGITTLLFERLATNFEIQFTEYLFSDYRVTREKTQDDVGWRMTDSRTEE